MQFSPLIMLMTSISSIYAGSNDLGENSSKTLFSLFDKKDSKPSQPPQKAKNPTTAMVQRAAKAVINLYVVQVSKQEVFNPFAGDPFMEFFFGGRGFEARPRVSYGSGSGVIVSEGGLIVTCAHVVDSADKIKAKLNNGREFDVKLLMVDKKNDLAFGQLQISRGDKLPIIPIGNSEQLEIAEPIYAIGNAFGLGQSVSSGIISATTRIVNGRVLLQTDASVNPGNSGGALIDMNGQLVGVPNAILSRSGASHGIGFAIPTALIKSQMNRIDKGDHSKARTWFGASVQSFNFDMAKALDGFDFSLYQGGAIVRKITTNSPAAKAGLSVNDVVVAINDHPIRSEEEYEFREEILNVGDSVTIKIWREKTGEMEIKFKVDATAQEELKEVLLNGKHLLQGYKIAKVTNALANEYKLHPSMIDRVIVVSEPDQQKQLGLNLNVGDILLEVNRKKIEHPDDVEIALKSSKGNGLSLVIQRGQSILQLMVG